MKQMPPTLYVKWMPGETESDGFWFTTDFPVDGAVTYRKGLSTINSGIYEILNTKNQKRYIGSSVNILTRWGTHLTYLKLGIHENKHLQKDFYDFGEDAFSFNVVEEAYENLRELEQKHINIHKGCCYNMVQAVASPENYREAPFTIRFTEEHESLIDAALKQAGLRRTAKGWFPRLLVILLVNYLEGAK